MDITLKLNKDFERCLEDLKKKYGEDFEYINGVHPSQLDFSEFIDNFVAKDTLADASVDPNANANHKDIRSFMSEKGKSEDKLFGLNKIFVTIKKQWGLRTAKQWLEQEFSKGFYLNDSTTASYFPYCFSGDTKIITDSGIKRLDSLVGKEIKVLGKTHGWEYATVEYFGKQELRKLTLSRNGGTREIMVTGNHRWFIKTKSGNTVLTTDELQPGMTIPTNYLHQDEAKNYTGWIVVSVEDTDVVDDVYCAVVPGTNAFTLDGNILTHNCWANDLTRLATEGLFFLDNYNHQPPKHLTTFFDDVIEFVSFLSNRQSGAVGLPNVLIWAYYFWKKDVNDGVYMKSPEYYARQNFQKFIYRLNQPFLRIDQSSFTNLSIFDRPYLESLFGGMEFPDGTFAIDEIEELIEFQKLFMDVVSETREDQMFTYPVLTYSLYYKDGKFQDEEFARWASAHNIKWSDSNFFVSDNIGVLSNCPLSADTQIMYYSDRYEKFFISPIKEVWDNTHRKDSPERTVKVLSNGKLVSSKINHFNVPIEYEIVLTNGHKIKTTADHLNKVYGKDYIKTSELTTEDYLPISTMPFNTFGGMSYEEGLLVGMFLGDGSYRNNSEIVFSLNDGKKQELIDFVLTYCPHNFAATVKINPCVSGISGKASCLNVSVNSQYLRGLIEMFVDGDNALNKSISGKAFIQSTDFRRGIIDGLYKTDGGNSNRIYTSSIKLRDSLVALFSTLGISTTITEDSRDGRLGQNPCYTVRYYTPGLRTHIKDLYIIDGGYMWFKIKEINKISSPSSHSYCIEVLDNTEPVFTLANGVVTHNCRLLSDTSKLDAFINSIGGTALSVGSCRVSTINLVRIAYESKFDKKKYLKILRDRVTLDCKALYSMRYIVKRNIEKGLLPNYQDGAVELDKQFCTIGGM